MLNWSEAKALIDEARKLHYKGTAWERDFVARLELMEPAVLRPEDERSLIWLYRKASGGESGAYKKSCTRR